ncbi:5aea1791-de3b-44bd-b511-1c7ceda42855 [Thermothielavioides terrestris]|uniref:5aea1791-de3b-44bd-b511-1c7ceda42855 n=1 Tax=Thermothielavioides terrestris TaxID=2587410 RepID=A0A3S4CAF6_9PEZI|nr:5aea1791-de3b-44bd-b511-1c7ceda42855 [Thermothielavioides terrestris]
MEHLEHLLLPAHVELIGEVLPFRRAGVPHETAVLRTETELGDVAEVLHQEILVAARNDPDGIVAVSGQGLQAGDDALRRDCRAGLSDDGGQGAVVVEHEQALLGGAVLAEQRRPVEQRRGRDVLPAAEHRHQPAQEAGNPVLHVLAGDVREQALLHGLALFLGHRERVVDLPGDASQIPRVDVNGVLERAGRAAELGQDQGPGRLALADYVFERRGVHAVSHRRNEADVGSAQQREVLVLADVLREVQHGREADGPIGAVDLHDQLVDAARDFILGVLFLLFDAGRRRHLDQHHLVAPLGIQLEEALERHELLRDAADAVQTVPAGDDLLVGVHGLERRELLVDRVGPGQAGDLGGVDADGEYANFDARAVGVDARAVRGEAQDAGAAAGEVARVAVALEADQVGAQHALQHLLAARQAPEVFAAGEGRVQVEGDVHVWGALTQHAWEQHQGVVVHHDDVAGLVDLENLVGEFLVHAVVVGPMHALPAPVARLGQLVVEEGIEVVLGVAPPSGLVLQLDAVLASVGIVGEPDWDGLDLLVMRELALEPLHVLLGNPQAVGRGRRRRGLGGVERDRLGERIERAEVYCREGRGVRRRQLAGCLDLARPCDDRVVPGRLVGRKAHTQSAPLRYVNECGILKVAEMMFPVSARSGLIARMSDIDAWGTLEPLLGGLGPLSPMAATLTRRR